MARLARLTLPGLPHQVILRGNNGQAVFVDDADRQAFLAVLAQYLPEHGMELHAWLLLPQAVHLLLTPRSADALSAFMQAIGRKYTRQFNQRHGRSGTLWEGRFRSTVLQAERYLVPCMVNMDTMPVRLGLVAEPQDHAWSSHAHHIGRQVDRLITPHPVYWQLGNTPFAREVAYARQVAEGLSEREVQALSQATQQGWLLGDAAFVDAWQPKVDRRLTRRAAGRPPKVPGRVKTPAN
ncbi:transposase [Curvibacter sp. HBC61]|uniref:Transposase n=1 Tax=Curvibacter cyanobacteriorum TaxID=3026422 RepID=A0ABT5N2A4_9BURK|nr:transposase [Curvibacter sp. HBC61]MDD0839182.1 transposase [Curvibacter sp. HBC61]